MAHEKELLEKSMTDVKMKEAFAMYMETEAPVQFKVLFDEMDESQAILFQECFHSFARKIVNDFLSPLSEEGEEIDIADLIDILKSDSVYWLLRYGTKYPSNSGINNCEDNRYYDLYNICCKLRK
jgi:hypothetical protein